ncbi:hypothetical protein B0A48_08454 [Cryoendolithus antarcticus]|uniref:XPG-I domain-containing protein n=1 Tax=Cryoendolithus antarcticus TaxID=1507870 RepID=A0A1V8T5I3_9PEZI|nr:hypothetical protein B0A48_08454 [Cryoendolithus antarcticus]
MVATTISAQAYCNNDFIAPIQPTGAASSNMGIAGILKELGPGSRTSLAALSLAHYRTHHRPLRLAIDISIWLFQILAASGGSNPALRTFYYRLLRLLSLNIHPLFVFDGPNKPAWKRGKRVGGPGVRVANVPEFLAKQLLKQFGFPAHVAPGEAEAECALLQREGIVDAVMSDDVDTLMFGASLTLRNWTPEGSSKVPTHVNVYRSDETLEKSGLDREGMILVALMSGGDYIPEGIPGAGPKVACDAARAGFGKDLCALRGSDKAGLVAWRDRLQHEVRTNESKLFSRRKTGFVVPADFPSQEVLGYYTHPCTSPASKFDQLRATLRWDAEIDYSALRSFAGDAFDWRCISGAQKFIRNLAPAMLVRNLRLSCNPASSQSENEAAKLIRAIHGKRKHSSTDNNLELRISFIPSSLVPIDLTSEPPDDEITPAGPGAENDDEADFPPASTPAETSDSEAAPTSPTKKARRMRPYDPNAPEKLWILRDWLVLGAPGLVEDFESVPKGAKAFFEKKAKAKAAAGAKGPAKRRMAKSKERGTEENALLRHVKVTKPGVTWQKGVVEEVDLSGPAASAKQPAFDYNPSAFVLPSSQVFFPSQRRSSQSATEMPTSQAARPFAPFTAAASQPRADLQRTPKGRKRRTPELTTPRPAGKAAITGYFSPTPTKPVCREGSREKEVVDLLSSSPSKPPASSPVVSATPPLRRLFTREDGGSGSVDALEVEPVTVRKSTMTSEEIETLDLALPSTVTKRRRKGPLRRWETAPVSSDAVDLEFDDPMADLARHNDFTIHEFNKRSSGVTVVDLESIASLPTPPAEDPPNQDLDPDASDDDLPDHFPPSQRPAPAANHERPIRRSPRLRPPIRTHSQPSQHTQPLARAVHANSTTVADLPSVIPIIKPAQQIRAKSKFVLRESLPGTWKEVEAEMLDLSASASKMVARKTRTWRESGVEMLDLTSP